MSKNSSNTSQYETTVKLPSKGILYEGVPEDVTLRAMTTNDEKIIFGSTTPNAVSKILQRCIVSPEDLDISKLTPSDESYLLLKLRTHTYGSDYPIVGHCPECGASNTYDINLDELPVTYLNDDFTEPFDIKLPSSEDTLSVRLLRNHDYTQIHSQTKKIAKKLRANVKELEFIYRMAKYIVKLNGEDIDQVKAQEYVGNLVGKDSAYFFWKINKIANFGVDTTSTVVCKDCGEEFDLPFEINSEFFRPKFDE